MRDLTKGSIIRLMLLFSLPILLGSLFQQAYNLVDIIIVGKKLGELSLSAVGSTTAVVSLMFNIINGLCTGFAIPVAKHYGANDMEQGAAHGCRNDYIFCDNYSINHGAVYSVC